MFLDVVRLEKSATWGDLVRKIQSEYEDSSISLYITNSSGYEDESFDNPKIDIDHSTKLLDFGHYEFDVEEEDYDFDANSTTLIVSVGKDRKIVRKGKVEILTKNEKVEVKLECKRFVSSYSRVPNTITEHIVRI